MDDAVATEVLRIARDAVTEVVSGAKPPEVSARERFGLLLQQRMRCWYEQVVVQC